MMRFVVLSIAFALLAGCVQTRFESLPGDQVEACDARWVGNWRVVITGEDDDPDELHASIGADCNEIRLFEDGKADDKNDARLHFAKVGNLSVLAVQILDDKHDKAEASADKQPDGYHYFRYVARARQIDLHAIDHERVAHLLVDGKLRGSIELNSQGTRAKRPRHDTLDNFVAGDPSAMAKAVRSRGLFKRRPHIALIRVDTIPTSAPSSPAEPSP